MIPESRTRRPRGEGAESIQEARTADGEGDKVRDQGPGRRAAMALSQFRDLPRHLLWAGAGFVAGILFWHVVGFWHFVAVVMLRGSLPEERAVAVLPPSMITTGSITTGSITPPAGASGRPQPAAAAVPNCSALVLDRRSGTTVIAHCQPQISPVRHVTGNGRGDLGARAAHVAPVAPVSLPLAGAAMPVP